MKRGTSINNIHQKAEDFVEQGLRSLGLLGRGQSVNKFFPHSIGHWLGMDVHDTKDVPSTTALEPGTWSIEISFVQEW